MLYTYTDELKDLISLKDLYKKRGLKNTVEKKFSINLAGLQDNYKVITYKIDEKKGSSYNNWLSLGKPKRIDEYEREILLKTSFPNIKLGFTRKTPVYNIVSRIEGYGAILITLQKVQKTS